MANIVTVYHALKPVIRGAFVNRKRYQSAYNAFVQANVGAMPVVRWDKATAILLPHPDIYIKGGQLGELLIASAASDESSFTFQSLSNELKVGDVLRTFKYDFNLETSEMYEYVLTAPQIATGFVNTVWNNPSTGIVLAYIITADRKKSTTCKALYY